MGKDNDGNTIPKRPSAFTITPIKWCTQSCGTRTPPSSMPKRPPKSAFTISMTRPISDTAGYHRLQAGDDTILSEPGGSIVSPFYLVFCGMAPASALALTLPYLTP